MKKSFIYQRLLFQIVKISLLQLCLILVFTGITMATPAKGQEMLDSKVTLNLSNVSLESALTELEKNTHVKFSYNSRTLKLSQKVNIVANSEALSSVLNKLLKPLNIKYVQVSNRIVLRRDDTQSLGFIQESELNTKDKLRPADITIKGVVTDEKGEGLPGVNVIIKNTVKGTMTDAKGTYSISVPDANSVLIFSYVGMQNEEVVVGANTIINVTLRESVNTLQEVVALGYTSQKQRDMIGSVAKVNSEQIAFPANNNIAASLQGKASGLYVSRGEIRIRGINSISLSTQPLWIIDGMPGDGSNLNPNDIESITVLKDASATALYGSRGSNGVIVVTTISMKNKKSQLNVELNTGVENYLGTDYSLLNTTQYLNVFDVAKQNAAKYSGDVYVPYDPNKAFDSNSRIPNRLTRAEAEGNSFDMLKEASRTGKFNQLYLSATKGFDKGNAFVTATYRTNTGQLLGLSSDKFITRIGVNFSPVKNLDINFSSINNFSSGINNSARLDLLRPPFMPLYDLKDNTGYWAPGDNPLISGDLNYRENSNSSLSSINYVKANLELPFIKGLSIGTSLGLNFGTGSSIDWFAKELRGLGQGTASNLEISYASEGKSSSRSYTYRGEINYNHIFGNHSIGVLALTEAIKGFSSSLSAFGSNLNGTYRILGTPATMNTMNSTISEGGSINYIGRFTYKFKERYLFEGNIRRDGLSTLSLNNRWATFPSIGLGWIVSDEPFFKTDQINLLKLRGSVGKTGNAAVPSFPFISAYRINNPGWYSYDNYQFTTIRNLASDVKWETADNLDIGFDFGLFANKINGSFAYYNKKTSGLLLAIPTPPSTGLKYGGGNTGVTNSIFANVGNMRNDGYEFNVTVKPINRNAFSWDISFNHTINRNKILMLDPSIDLTGQGIFGSSNFTLTKKGEKLATYYLPEFAGIDPEKGIPMIYERDANIFATTGETVKTGNIIPATSVNGGKNQFLQTGKSGIPDFYGGLRNAFRYKGIDMHIMITYSGGNYFIDQAKSQMTTVVSGANNLSTEILEGSWKKPGDIAQYPEYIYNGGFYYNDKGEPSKVRSNVSTMTTQYLLPGDYIQLREVSLGYTLPKLLTNKLKLSNVRLSGNVNNLGYWAKAGKQGNPELQILNSNIDGVVRGLNFLTRTYSLSLSVNF